MAVRAHPSSPSPSVGLLGAIVFLARIRTR
jgi:hypothetical protein